MRPRLSTKLIVSIVAVQAMMLLLLVWNSVRLIDESHTRLMEQSIEEETVLLVNALSPGLAAQDRALLMDTLSLLKSNKKLEYAVVYNRDNIRMASIGDMAMARSHNRGALLQGQQPGNNVYIVKRPIMLAGQSLGRLEAGFSLKLVQEIRSRTRMQNTLIALLALLSTMGITVLAGYYLKRRLQYLENGARALSNGNLDHRIPVVGNDEVADVSRSFNEMAQRLQKTRQDLKTEHGALLRETTYLNTLLNGVDAVVIETSSSNFQFNYVSNEAKNLLGFELKDWFEPEFFWERVHPDDRDWLCKRIKGEVEKNNSFIVDFRMILSDGKFIWVRGICSVDKVDGDSIVIRGLLIDINEQKKTEEQIVYLADHDDLTGLMNRRRFQEELKKNIALAKRYNYIGGLLFIDLDQFKYVNDTMGHHRGDEYLISVASCLSSVLREVDVFARLGGDEFGVVIPRCDEQEIQDIAKKILQALAGRTQDSEELTAKLSASIGIVMFPKYGDEPGDLLAKADAAMYAVKAKGRNDFHVFRNTDQQLVKMQEKIRWEDRIHRALSEDLFLLHYQPVVDLRTGEIAHHEALLRMRDPDTDDLIFPNMFLETAERFGLIREIDLWVLENCIRTYNEQHLESNGASLAVNISGRNFGNKELLIKLEQWFKQYKVNPKYLIFEVTETAAVENIFQAKSFIKSLQELGCKFALDDFGVGFSSLHYLKHLPVDFIKIDGSFISGISHDENDRILVKAICDIAKGMGVSTVAEFVDSYKTLETVQALGVDFGQGYYLGRPQQKIEKIKWDAKIETTFISRGDRRH